MAAGRYNLVIEQGATFKKRLTIQKNASPWILTGYEARAQIRRSASDDTKITDIGVTITDPANGIIDLLLTSVQTTALAAYQRAEWDLELDDKQVIPGVTRLLEGDVEIRAEVTRHSDVP